MNGQHCLVFDSAGKLQAQIRYLSVCVHRRKNEGIHHLRDPILEETPSRPFKHLPPRTGARRAEKPVPVSLGPRMGSLHPHVLSRPHPHCHTALNHGFYPFEPHFPHPEGGAHTASEKSYEKKLSSASRESKADLTVTAHPSTFELTVVSGCGVHTGARVDVCSSLRNKPSLNTGHFWTPV